MRLKNKKRGCLVGPASCVALLALITLGMVFPQVDNTYAADDTTGYYDKYKDKGNGWDCSYAASCSSTTTVQQKETQTAAEKKVFMDNPENNGKDNKTGNASFEVVQEDKYNDATASVGGITDSNSDGKDDGYLGWTVVQDDNYEDAKASVDPFNLEYVVKGYIELTQLGDNMDVNVDVQPTITDGGFATASTSFQVAGNNNDGFGIYVYAKEDGKTSLTSASEDNKEAIAPIATSAKQSDFGYNTWGYTVTENTTSVDADTTFYGLTNQSDAKTPVFTYEKPTAGMALKLVCGAKVNVALPADTYSTQVVISAVAPFNASLIQPSN